MTSIRLTLHALAGACALFVMAPPGRAEATAPSSLATLRATEVCTGQFAEIQLHNDRTRDYIHYGGIQQCTPDPAHQALTIMLFRVDGKQRTLVAQRSDSKVIWTLAVWGEPLCDSKHTATYQMSAQGTADDVPSNPWPVAWSKKFTLNCWIDGLATSMATPS